MKWEKKSLDVILSCRFYNYFSIQRTLESLFLYLSIKLKFFGMPKIRVGDWEMLLLSKLDWLPWNIDHKVVTVLLRIKQPPHGCHLPLMLSIWSTFKCVDQDYQWFVSPATSVHQYPYSWSQAVINSVRPLGIRNGLLMWMVWDVDHQKNPLSTEQRPPRI